MTTKERVFLSIHPEGVVRGRRKSPLGRKEILSSIIGSGAK